jgi:hypothetical protein
MQPQKHPGSEKIMTDNVAEIKSRITNIDITSDNLTGRAGWHFLIFNFFTITCSVRNYLRMKEGAEPDTIGDNKKDYDIILGIPYGPLLK